MRGWMQRGVLLAIVLLVVGCNTMAGLGRDVGKLGGKIEQKAEQKRRY